MSQGKPTYNELVKRLAKAEELISALNGHRLNNALSERDIARDERNTALAGARDLKEAYLESEQNFRNSMDACPLGIRVITADGDLFYANQAILDICGYSTVEELKAVPRAQLYTPESYAAHLSRKEKRRRGEYVPSDYEIGIRRPDGTVRTLRVLRKEITWGGQRQFMAMYEDITARLQAEEALRSREAFLNHVIESTPSPLWVSDEKGTVIRMNQSLRDLLKIKDEEIIGKYNVLKDTQVIEQGYLPLVKSVYEEGRTVSFTLNYATSREVQVNLTQTINLVLDVVISAVKNARGRITHVICQERDVTDRVKTEEALKENQEMFSKAFHNSPVLMLITSQKEGRIVEVNDVFCSTTGYSREELLGRTTTEMKLWSNRGQRKPILDVLKEKGIASGVEVELRVKNGELKTINMSVANITLKNEPCLITIAEDITDRKKAQEELIVQRDFSQSMFDTAQVIMLVLEPDGRINVFNPYLEDITGYKLEEVYNKCWFDIFIPERERARIKKLFSKAIDNIQTKGNINAIVTKDGREREIEWYDKTLKDINGNVIGLLAVGQDVTERIKVEAALKESEAKYHLIFDNSQDAILLAIPDGTILAANPAACRMFGRSEEDICRIGRNGLIDASDPRLEKALKQREATSEFIGELTFLRADGTRFPGDIASKIFRDKDGNQRSSMIIRDITERKNAERALRESEERYRSSLDNMMEGCQIVDRDWRYVYVNDAIAMQSRQRKEDLIGRTMMEVYPGIEKTEMFAVLKDCMANRTSHRLENEFTFANGSRGWFDLSIHPVPEGIFILSLDITEHRRAEMAIHESEERFRRIFQAGPLGIVLSNLDYQFTMMNARFCEMYGYSEKELLTMTFKDISFPEDIAENIPNLQKLAKGELTNYTTEKRYIKKDGDVFWGSLIVTMIRDNAGNPQGFLSMVQNITPRKQAEERINHLNLALRSIRNVNQLITREKDRQRLIQGICDNLVGSRSFNSAWIVLLDDSRQPVMWAQANKDSSFPALVELFRKRELPHCAQKALKHKSVVITNDPQTECAECAECPIKGENNDVGNMTIRLEIEGNIYGILCASMPRNLLINEDEVSLFVEVATDIAFALRDIELGATNELLQQERLRAAKLESIGTLAGGIAHDFNNLLTGIMGNIGLAKSYLPPSAEVFEMLDEAEKAAARSRDLTQQLLTFARGGKPIKKVINIARVIREAAAFAVRGSKVRLELSVPDNLWLAEADEGQISQVIHNLVINADEAMPAGGIIKIQASNLSVKRTVALPLAGGKYIQIDVADSGIGISPEHLQRIFEPYFTTKHQGSGLGLTSAYSIVKNHGGLLLAESVLNQGSIFHIYLPASKKTTKGEKKVAATKSTQAGGKVLVMDDDETIRKMLKNMLNLAGYEVELTADGVEALGKYKQAIEANDPFTAVIMDLTIPGGMGGKEAIKNLLEIDPAAAVIVSSGYATDPIMSEYKKYGFSAVIAKPYSISQLQETISGLKPWKK